MTGTSRLEDTVDLIEQLAAIEHQRWAHWQRYVHEMANYVYQKFPSRDGVSAFATHGIEQAQLELRLTLLVTGWLKDDAGGHKRSFPELVLSRPPDLRNA